MAKIRGVKPEFWTDEKVVEVSPLARLLFIGLWTYACDNGHVEDRPRQLKMRILPADDCDVDVLLDELIDIGMVTRGGGVIRVPKLGVHQRVDKRWFTTCTLVDGCVNPHLTEGPTSGPRGGHVVATSSARGGHVVATSGPRDELNGVDGDGDGDTTTARKRGHRLPDDWQPTAELLSWAAERFPNIDARMETDKFRDHWHAKAGRDATKLDWALTWKNWIRNAKAAPAWRTRSNLTEWEQGFTPTRPRVVGGTEWEQ